MGLTTKPTLSYETEPDMSAVGTYAITASGADAGDKYEINYVNGTLTVLERTSSGGGGGGGSSSYSVSVDKNIDNGKVTVSPSSASSGRTVTITVKPDEGYELDYLTVTDKNGDEIKLTDKGDGKYTFTMPQIGRAHV